LAIKLCFQSSNVALAGSGAVAAGASTAVGEDDDSAAGGDVVVGVGVGGV
jgi:hypothetical protein